MKKWWLVRAGRHDPLLPVDVAGQGGLLFSNGGQPFETRREARLLRQAISYGGVLELWEHERVMATLVAAELDESRNFDWWVDSEPGWPPSPHTVDKTTVKDIIPACKTS